MTKTVSNDDKKRRRLRIVRRFEIAFVVLMVVGLIAVGASCIGLKKTFDNGGYSGHYYNSYPMGYSRARNARRDSMGRYSRGYSRGDEMAEQVRDLMDKAPDDQTRRDFQRILDRMEK